MKAKLVRESLNFDRGGPPLDKLQIGYVIFSLKNNQFLEGMDSEIQRLSNEVLSNFLNNSTEEIYFLGNDDNLSGETYMENLENLIENSIRKNSEKVQTDSFDGGEITLYETTIGEIAGHYDGVHTTNYWGGIEAAGALNIQQYKNIIL